MSTLRATESFAGATCYMNDLRLWVIDLFPDPPVGDGFYYLVRGSEPYCDETPTYRTFHPRENPTDPGKRDEEIAVCPDP